MRLFQLVAVVSAFELSACELQDTPTSTTVEGTITNKYTRQPLVGVPLEVTQWRYGAYGNTQTDSVAGTRSGPDGHFSIAFDGNAKGVIYRVRFREYRHLFDLTDYRPFDSQSFTDGASLVLGQANHVNFEATHFVPVRVVVDTNKRSKTSLDVGFFSYLSTDNGAGFWGDVLMDTARVTQQIIAARVVQVVPNRGYRFLLTRYNTVRIPNGNISLSDEVVEASDHFIGNNDTTTIRLH